MARWYTDDEKATALAVVAACGGSTHAASAKCGVPARTLASWMDGSREPGPQSRIKAEPKKISLDNILTIIAHDILDSVPGRDWSTVPPVQCMTAAAIAIDKSLLLRGEPSEIIETRRAVGDDMATAMGRMTPEQRDELAGHLSAIDRLVASAMMDKVDQLDKQSADVPIDDGKPTDKPTAPANPDE